MRLHNGDHALVAALHITRGAQHGCDLHRVVAVVVDDIHAIPVAHRREPSLDAAELQQRRTDLFFRAAKLARDCNGRQRVLHIVTSRHRQLQADPARLIRLAARTQYEIEHRSASFRLHVHGPQVRLWIEAIGNSAPIRDARGQRLHFGMVGAQHREAIERQVLDEGVETLPQRFHRAVVIHVFGIDVGDDADGRAQLGEGAVALIGLHHHPLALPEFRVRGIGVDDAAIDHCGVEAHAVEQRRHHRCRRRLAMRTGDRDRPFQPDQLGQHVGPAHHRNGPRPRRIDFRIAALDRGRDHQRADAFDVLGLVADHDLGAALGQPIRVRARLHIGAGNLIAKVDHHLGDARHADAANADKMHRADVEGDCSTHLVSEPAAGPGSSPAVSGLGSRLRHS